MSEHRHPGMERQCDVAVVGGAAAGLAAAAELGRQRRLVIVAAAGEPDHAGLREEVRRHGGEVLAARVLRVVSGPDGFRLELVGDHAVVARRVLAATGTDERSEIVGLTEPPDSGPVVEIDSSGATSVPGLYAVGQLSDPSHGAARGRQVGVAIADDLAHDDLVGSVRPPANERDWDHRYSGPQIWSGNPNGSLVREVEGLTPGRALDVGAGEGGDALWLAEHGWAVTANDVSGVALDRIRAEADRRGLAVECQRADANGEAPFRAEAFDLVSAHYASIPRTPEGQGVRNLIDAVAPGGLLLVVGHDPEPMRAPLDTRTESRAFDPDAYLRTDDFAEVLGPRPEWNIEFHALRPRPPGAASSHHVDDLVLRARRTGDPDRAR